MNKIKIQYYSCKYGELILGSFNNLLCMCDWKESVKRDRTDRRISKTLDATFLEEDSPIHEIAIKQLEEYFKGDRKGFDLPLLLIGSEFQKKVWETLKNIPYGETMSYTSQAKLVGGENKVRAVANANGANAISIIIPCHRVIGKNGKLTGYAGGVLVKESLINFEKGEFDGKR